MPPRPPVSGLSLPRWPAFAAMDPSQRVLTVAIGVSLLLHAIVLSIHFKVGDRLQKLVMPPALDVVLVNAKSHKRPPKADVLAQANVDGGGDTDDNRRAKSPLPVTASESHGTDLQRARQRVRELETRQRQLLSQSRPSVAQTAPASAPATVPTPQPDLSGADLVSRSMEMLKLQAQIARQTDEYNKRPRKLFVGVRASEYPAAQYLDEWVRRVERIGNLNYPEMARGKVYGDVQISVEIKPDGSLDRFDILRPSGYAVLDRAAESIVRMAAPFAAIPANVLKGNDVLVITRTVIFARGDHIFSD